MTGAPTECGLRESAERWPAGLIRCRVMVRRTDAGYGNGLVAVVRGALQRPCDRRGPGLRAGKQAQQAMHVGRAASELSLVKVRGLGDASEQDGRGHQPRDVAARPWLTD